jgi:hypothetical protein
VLKAPGILMVPFANRGEPVRLNAFYAHPIMAPKNKPDAHSLGLALAELRAS